MNMYDRINAGVYTAPNHPGFLGKPQIRRTPTAKQVAEQAVKLAEYEAGRPARDAALVAWRIEQNRLDSAFKADAIADVFGDDVKRFPATVEKLWSIAYYNGHSNGLNEVYMQLLDFTAVIAAAKEDVEKCNTEYKAVITRLSIRCAEAEICASVDNAQVAAIVSRIEDEKITALRLEVSSLKETIATLSTHIANSMEDGDDWLDSYNAGETICHICDQPISGGDMDSRHWHHEDRCTYGTKDYDGCECDLEAHAECCKGCRDDFESVLVKIEPQPAHTTGYWWMYNDLPYTHDELRSYLFHQVYGSSEGNSTVFEECHPVLEDGVWYWKGGEAQ